MHCSHGWLLNTIVFEDYNPSSTFFQKWAPNTYNIVVQALLGEHKTISNQLFGWAAHKILKELRQSQMSESDEKIKFFRIHFFLDSDVPQSVQRDPERLNIYSHLYANFHEKEIKASVELIKNLIDSPQHLKDNQVFNSCIQSIIGSIPYYPYLEQSIQKDLFLLQTYFLRGRKITVANKDQAKMVEVLAKNVLQLNPAAKIGNEYCKNFEMKQVIEK